MAEEDSFVEERAEGSRHLFDVAKLVDLQFDCGLADEFLHLLPQVLTAHHGLDVAGGRLFDDEHDRVRCVPVFRYGPLFIRGFRESLFSDRIYEINIFYTFHNVHKMKRGKNKDKRKYKRRVCLRQYIRLYIDSCIGHAILQPVFDWWWLGSAVL